MKENFKMIKCMVKANFSTKMETFLMKDFGSMDRDNDILIIF